MLRPSNRKASDFKYCPSNSTQMNVFAVPVVVVILVWSAISPAQNRPANRFEEIEKKKAAGMIEGIRNKLPEQPPQDLAESLKTWREVHEFLQSGARAQIPSLLHHVNPAVRREAVLTLAELSRNSNNAEKAVDELSKLLDSPNIEFRTTAYFAIARMAPQGKSALPKVYEAMKHSDPRIRRAAYQVISHWYPYDKEMLPHVIDALDDPDVGPWKDQPLWASVSLLAIDNLSREDLAERAREGGRTAVPKLEKIIRLKNGCEAYEGRAIAALATIAPDNKLVLSLAREWLKSEDGKCIRKGAGLVGSLGEHAKEAIPDLIEAANRAPDPNAGEEQKNKITIAHAFQRLGPIAIDALPLLKSLSATDDFAARREIQLAIESVSGRKKK